MNDERVKTAGIIAVVIILIALIAFAIIYRRTDYIRIYDRYWRYGLRVQYDRTETRMVMDTRRVCTGFGSSETCTTQSVPRLVTETHTYTRCSTHADGRQLPPEKPQVPCRMQPGDYLSETISYHAAFTLIDGEGRLDRTFAPALWDTLEPGSRRTVERDLFGHIVAMGHER